MKLEFVSKALSGSNCFKVLEIFLSFVSKKVKMLEVLV